MPKPFIIPLFLPNAGCPHQCAFCNQRTITNTKEKKFPPEKIPPLIDEYIAHKGKNRDRVQVAFYGGNFLGLEKGYIESLLEETEKYVESGVIHSIRFSTRPDTINNAQLDIIDKFSVKTVEVGVQSMNDKVLAMSQRGHTSYDTQKALALLKERGYETGAQIMTGLPNDNEKTALLTAQSIVALKPDFARIYPTVVLADSTLARWYKNGTYSPLSLNDCVTLAKKIYLKFSENSIPVIRMGLQAADYLKEGTSILAGPYHPSFGHMVFSEIFLDMAVSALKNGFELQSSSLSTSLNTAAIKVHPSCISKVRGIKNKNIKIIKEKFQIKDLKIIPDPTVKPDRLIVDLNGKSGLKPLKKL